MVRQAASRLAASASQTNATTLSTMPKIERVRRNDLAGGQGPVVRAAHELVAVALDPAVDRVGAAGREGAADEHRDEEPGRGEPAAASSIGGTDVTRSSSMTRGLVRRTYAPNDAAPVEQGGAFGGGLQHGRRLQEEVGEPGRM